MSLHVRLRGKIYYARGSIRVGKDLIHVREFSTGATTKQDAQATADAEERRIRDESLGGPKEKLKRSTLADCFESYLTRPIGLSEGDQNRIEDFSDRVGHYPVSEAKTAWQEWVKQRALNLKPGTIARQKNAFQAAVNHGLEQLDLPTIKLPAVKLPTSEGVVYLSIEEQDRLLAAYADHVRPIMTLLCFGGLRTNEALRLDWRFIRFEKKEILVAQDERVVAGPRTKSGKSRSVPMHFRVLAELTVIWEKQNKPTSGHVFLTPRGKPYYDNRSYGGSPMKTAHAGACKRAKIENFRVHDWRHHWASWMVMRGVDLATIRKIGGWATLTMLQRYAAVSDDHMHNAIGRL